MAVINLDTVLEQVALIRSQIGRKFEDYLVMEPQASLADQYLQLYSGDFSFMLSVREQWQARGLSRRQYASVLNCAYSEALRQHEALKAEHRASCAKPASKPSGVPNGTYTVQFPDGSHVTIRLKLAHFGDQDRRIAQYLSGSDNESDYTSFAFINPGGFKIWQKYVGKLTRQQEALKIILASDLNTAADMGQAYAIASGRCWRCNRMLTVPASIGRGLGPICADALGL